MEGKNASIPNAEYLIELSFASLASKLATYSSVNGVSAMARSYFGFTCTLVGSKSSFSPNKCDPLSYVSHLKKAERY